MTAVGVRIQALRHVDQTVVLSRLAESRSGDGRFLPADVRSLYDDIGLPRPPHLSNAIAALQRRGLAARAGTRGRWRLTPIGRERAGTLVTTDEMLTLERESASATGSLFGGTVHPVLPPWLAPPGLERRVATFLEDHPFSRNVFGMTRYPDAQDRGPDPVGEAVDVARDACDRHGLELHLASTRSIADDLWGNVAAHMWACQYGIALFEDRQGHGLNHNLAIEVGAMLMAGRRCALLKDETAARMPTDLAGQIYRTVNLADPTSVRAAIHGWARDDLSLGACGAC